MKSPKLTCYKLELYTSSASRAKASTSVKALTVLVEKGNFEPALRLQFASHELDHYGNSPKP
ncbi:hypothetical protein F2Q69_00034234 [Brassica cretica]|uniref:Uncharacterized protein n=1 Tax=Brassica cretica TaxID=69181 RepID=A0A8S9SHB7_BRACR|nr:hypothetical protein F2Q69_00034234 [Brassica cretica]